MSKFSPPNAQNPQVFVVTDCYDGDAKLRQLGELARYLECYPGFAGADHEISLGMIVVSLLKTFRGGKKGLILGNVAPREGTTQNGSRFGYFKHGEVFVLISVTPITLFLIAKLKIAESIHVLDTEKTTDFLIEKGFVDPIDREDIIYSQFRSAMFTPPAGAYLLLHGDLPSTCHAIELKEELNGIVGVRDRFGNLKTTTTSLEVGEPKDGTLILTKLNAPWNHLPYYSRLSLVPDGIVAITRGSSGIGEHRFLELIIKGKGKSAGATLNLDVGSRIF